MKRETQEPFNYKIRDALIQLKMRKLGGNKQVCVQGNLLGVSLLAKGYKSKRSIKFKPADSSNQQNADSEVRCELFKRINSKTRKKSGGLQITKAVMHFHQNKRPRVATERPLTQNQQKNIEAGRESKFNGSSTRVLKSHRDNSLGRFSYYKNNQKTQQDFRPTSAYTQVYREMKSRKGAKPFSMHMRFKTDYQILEPDIEGWNSQYPEQPYFPERF